MNTVYIDIGCGDGSRMKTWLESDQEAFGFCIDPRQSCYDSALKLIASVNSKKTKLQRMHPIRAAVTEDAMNPSGDNTAILYCLNDPSSCSLLRLEEKNIKRWQYPAGRLFFKETESMFVPAIRMDKFLADRRIEQVVFVRIETQGTAIDVLKSFGKRLSTVMEFAIKVHVIDYDIYVGQTKRQELLDFMTANGFVLFGICPWSRDQEEIIWFVNKKMGTSQRLKHFDLE